LLPPITGVTTFDGASVGPQGGSPLPPLVEFDAGGGAVNVKCAWAVAGSASNEAARTRTDERMENLRKSKLYEL
jgi:hypothetical protein